MARFEKKTQGLKQLRLLYPILGLSLVSTILTIAKSTLDACFNFF
jgi:hypothetical protein